MNDQLPYIPEQLSSSHFITGSSQQDIRNAIICALEHYEVNYVHNIEYTYNVINPDVKCKINVYRDRVQSIYAIELVHIDGDYSKAYDIFQMARSILTIEEDCISCGEMPAEPGRSLCVACKVRSTRRHR